MSANSKAGSDPLPPNLGGTKRGSFGSKLGIVLATAGSAVGLGNVWRFPYMTGENGGAAFILVYIVCILLLGIPGMIGEFVVGRYAQTNAARAYDILSRGKLLASIAGQLRGDAEAVKDYFVTFSSNPLKPVIWGVAFILVTHVVVIFGVRKGIERASKWLMPILLILLLVLVVASCLLPNAMEGVRFLFEPDFSKVDRRVFLDALGQAFFSLSLGTACLCTYASYFSKTTNLLRSAGQIALLDTVIAILSGLMIFPAAFSVGVNPDSGPSLIFITLPNVFQQAFGGLPFAGYLISVMFYALLVFAALTSTISMHEIGTAFFTEEFHLPRMKSAWIPTVIASVLCVFCSWSVGAYDIQVLGLSLMDFCDMLTADYMLPLGGFFTCMFVGWYIPKKIVHTEFTNEGQFNHRYFNTYLFAVRYVCPIAILLVFLHQLGVI